MSDSLKTKNVFLTGGAQGLGKSYVDALLAKGARVVFGDINPTVGAATEKEFVEKYGKDKVKFIEFDVTDGSKFEDAFRSAVEYLGYVDLMVNNAGFMIESLWEKMIQLNYTGVVKGTFLAYEHMRKDKGGKGGRIVNISSEFGLLDAMLVPVYCGTKHAVRAFTSSLAMGPDAKQLGLEYGVLCPGPADTDLLKNMDETKIRHPHLVTPEDLAKVTNSVERIQSGFMKLVLLEEMNGAILYVPVNEMNFYKIEKVNLGEDWPVKQEASSSTTSS
ncbi:15-hydroxyprostaglandin dehydrogenase [Elysia marginata]|uniref:15-hydroxyprostaglandin dehydrogenase [NAD(+)] n=1 Tax=Elysia marginata TaxID=1093978 RepID=A0AAV4IQK0_9GAST|nr:15-hydroxyprostaglandin dehydrogenase [Elysia marginata]